jgi:hypothetical protein
MSSALLHEVNTLESWLATGAPERRRAATTTRGSRGKTKTILSCCLLVAGSLTAAEPLQSARTLEKALPTRASRIERAQPPLDRHEPRRIDPHVVEVPSPQGVKSVLSPPAASVADARDAPTSSGLSYMREREELASAFRALAAAGLSAASGLGNHLTMSVPPDYTSFLLNRCGRRRPERAPTIRAVVATSGRSAPLSPCVRGSFERLW